ncbi:MAG: hypothetical protein WC374_00220 [Phycisphaerae bacterium]
MDKVITNIVFTKNRPLQLEGYLRSLYRCFPSELLVTYIIYKQELFTERYNSVFDMYKDIHVVTESDFHSDVLREIANAKTKYILFGIDDVVFFDGVDFELIDKTFESAGDEIFGFTLRFSPESLQQGPDEITGERINGHEVYKLDWTKGKTSHTRYPFELCSTFYRTDLVKKILSGCINNNAALKKLFGPKSIAAGILSPLGLRRSLLKRFGFFYSPNTFESWLCRWCQNHSKSLPRFTYFQKLCATAIQVNVVNTTTASASDGTAEHTVEALNEKFSQGYRLDIDYVAQQKPRGPACRRDYFRLTKD